MTIKAPDFLTEHTSTSGAMLFSNTLFGEVVINDRHSDGP